MLKQIYLLLQTKVFYMTVHECVMSSQPFQEGYTVKMPLINKALSQCHDYLGLSICSALQYLSASSQHSLEYSKLGKFGGLLVGWLGFLPLIISLDIKSCPTKASMSSIRPYGLSLLLETEML